MKKILAKIKKHWFLFLISLIADGLGIYGFISAQQATTRIDKIESNISQINETGNISLLGTKNSAILGNIESSQVYQNSSIQQTVVPKTPEEKRSDDISQKAKSTLFDFYNAIYTKNFERMKVLSDNTFIGDPNLSKNFSVTHLSKFLETLDGTWKIQNIEEDGDKSKDEKFVSRRGFNYEMYYTLKNGESYRDKWNVIVKYDPESNKFFINSLNCETKRCINQPFFTLKN